VAHQVLNFDPFPTRPQFSFKKARNLAEISFVSLQPLHRPGTHQNANPKSGVEKEHQGHLFVVAPNGGA